MSVAVNPTSFLDWLPCQSGWLPTNHLLFHFANVCLFLSYCAPPGLYGLLYLRVVLFFACFFFAWWGWFVLCAMDTFVWNAIFTVMNLVQTYIVWTMLPPKIEFPRSVERLFHLFFLNLKVSIEEFDVLYQSAREIVYLKEGDLYGIDEQETCLIIDGALTEYRIDGHGPELGQFDIISKVFEPCNSPYFHSGARHFTSFKALKSDTIIIVWPNEDLQDVFLKDKHLKLLFQALVSTKKLTVMRPTSMSTQKVMLPLDSIQDPP